MAELKPCPLCRVPPEIGYACGEYFICGANDDCPICGVAFVEMHSSEEQEAEAWNRRVDDNERHECKHCCGTGKNILGEKIAFCELTDMWMNIDNGDCFGNCESQKEG